MWSSLAFACFLVGLSIALTVQHVRARRSIEWNDSEARQVDYARRQFRRRMLASLTIGLIGIAVAGGVWITGPITTLLYWTGVFFAAVLVALLAMLDMVSIRLHYSVLHQRQKEAYEALRDELHRLRARSQNGHGLSDDGRRGEQ